LDGKGHWLAVVRHNGEPTVEQITANAEFIVRACNMHDELVKVLQVVVDNWTSQFERNGHLAPQWVKEARAVLTKASSAPTTTHD